MKLVRRRFFSLGKETPVRLSRDLELVGTGGRRVRVERKEGEIKLNQRRGGFGDWTFVLPLEARYNFTFFVSKKTLSVQRVDIKRPDIRKEPVQRDARIVRRIRLQNR